VKANKETEDHLQEHQVLQQLSLVIPMILKRQESDCHQEQEKLSLEHAELW